VSSDRMTSTALQDALRRAEDRMSTIVGLGVPGHIPSEVKPHVARLLNEGIADIRRVLSRANSSDVSVPRANCLWPQWPMCSRQL
jgi:hypothetical protein